MEGERIQCREADISWAGRRPAWRPLHAGSSAYLADCFGGFSAAAAAAATAFGALGEERE